MSIAKKSAAIRKQMNSKNQELHDLEAQAAIAEAAEKMRKGTPNYIGVYDAADPDSDEHWKLVKREAASYQQRTTRDIRNLYFGVSNVQLRKELIMKERQIGSLALDYWQQERSDAASKLEAARTTRRYWWLLASIFGIALLGLGIHFFGPIGALGGLLVGYFMGRQIEHEAVRARDSAVADAEQELEEINRIWNETRNEKQTFSQREAETGMPDDLQERLSYA